jgi:PUA domain protein
LTSKGGNVPPGLLPGMIVAIMAEGKENALAIGTLKMSSEAILKVNKGIGVELIHFLGDGLWECL